MWNDYAISLSPVVEQNMKEGSSMKKILSPQTVNVKEGLQANAFVLSPTPVVEKK